MKKHLKLNKLSLLPLVMFCLISFTECLFYNSWIILLLLTILVLSKKEGEKDERDS